MPYLLFTVHDEQLIACLVTAAMKVQPHHADATAEEAAIRK